MFNLKKHNKVAAITPYEKYPRNENVGPKADDNQAIWEKELPHRTGDVLKTTTEDHLKHADKVDDSPIIEKVLDEAQSYVPHRSDGTWLPVPPMSALVEKMQQNRMSDWKTEKKPHWSQSEKKQNGDLPKWPKNAPQHDKIVLNNDPRRFEKIENLPVHQEQSKNDAARNRSNDITPLVGNITKADINRVAHGVKTGESIDYDTAIVAILREAEMEKRELTKVEQKSISDLKVARTKAMLQKVG